MPRRGSTMDETGRSRCERYGGAEAKPPTKIPIGELERASGAQPTPHQPSMGAPSRDPSQSFYLGVALPRHRPTLPRCEPNGSAGAETRLMAEPGGDRRADMETIVSLCKRR